MFSNKTREWLLQKNDILFSKMAPKLRKLYQEGRKAIINPELMESRKEGREAKRRKSPWLVCGKQRK